MNETSATKPTGVRLRAGVIKSSELAQMSSWVAGDILDCQQNCDLCDGSGYRDMPDYSGECQNCDGRGYVFKIPDPKVYTVGEIFHTAMARMVQGRSDGSIRDGWAQMTPSDREEWNKAANFLLAFLEEADAIEVKGYAERYPLQMGLLNERQQTDMLRQHEDGLKALSDAVGVSAAAIIALNKSTQDMASKIEEIGLLVEALDRKVWSATYDSDAN